VRACASMPSWRARVAALRLGSLAGLLQVQGHAGREPISLNLQGPSEAAAEYHDFDGGENGSPGWRIPAIGRHRVDLWLRETLSAR
jgi:hypothetical protein